MRIVGSILQALFCVSLVTAQTTSPPSASAKPLPRFEDYPVAEQWHDTPALVRLTTASERLFQTKLTEASKQPPNFAGHYRFTFWGCGSDCGAGAVVDLQTGVVHPPPLGAHGNGWDRWIISPLRPDVDFRLDSKLVIVRGGVNYSERLKTSVPDVSYFVWDGERFRQLLYISGKEQR